MYGDTVRVQCRFLQPEHLRDRLTLSGTCTAFRSGDLQVLSRGGGSLTIRAITRLHRTLVTRVDQLLPEPTAGIVAGMILGVRRQLDGDLLEAFRATGTIHILVVSGFHMTFIGMRFRKWLLRLGILPRSTTAWIALMILAVYVVMVGLQPSAVRGALVVAAILAADLLGRVGNPVRALLLIATAMVAAHPHTLAFDLGFQLSFAAAAALILLAPILDAWLRTAGKKLAGWLPHPRAVQDVLARVPWRHEWGSELRDLLAASIAASLATASILLGAFGTIAPISPLVNIPVLLLVPFLMGLGIIFVGAALFIPPLAFAIAWALGVLSDALIAVVRSVQHLPGAGMVIGQADWWFVLGLEALLTIAVFTWYRRRHLPILSPFLSQKIAAATNAERPIP
jgi:competence protein ComEC